MAYNTERILPSQFSELISAIGAGGGGGGGTISFNAEQFAALLDAIGHRDTPAEYITYNDTTVKSALDNLEDLVNNNPRIAVCTGTLPSAVSGNVATTIPSGWTSTNCCPISPVQYFNTNGTWYALDPEYAICYHIGRVNYKKADANINNRPFRVLFYKFG